MTEKRRSHSAEFKFRLALEAVKGEQTINQIASAHSVHPTQVRLWKRQLLESGPGVFSDKQHQQEKEQAIREAELYEQIGRLKMELEWLKKKLAAFP
jgi:transposase-like protein